LPGTPPTAVNQTIETLNGTEAVWGMTNSALPLLPGEILVLKLYGAYLNAGLSWLSLLVRGGTADGFAMNIEFEMVSK
jgi:hypothetical protein